MSRLSKVLLSFCFGIGSIGGASAGLAWMVTYKPYGVPDHRRAEYERKIAQFEQPVQQANQLADEAVPEAVIDRKHHEFGMLDPHTTASHAFKIRNEGDAPLQLDVRETSCKCTAGTLDQSVVLGGESTSVTLTWNTGYKVDDYEQTATLTTNDPKHPTIELTVSGRVRAKLVAPERVRLPAADPGTLAEGSFVLYSQLWKDFSVVAVESDLSGFHWSAEPIMTGDGGAITERALRDAEAISAWRVIVSSLPNGPGAFSGKITLRVAPVDGGEPVERTAAVDGKVRASISFLHPDIHRGEGLVLGTVVSNTRHESQVIVRQRSGEDRDLAVLDVKPQILEASLKRIASRPGNYRLTLTLPQGCPTTAFNLDSQHGYVQVGDPEEPAFSNWMPVRGAVVKLDD